MITNKTYDVIIIGAGAAGLMCAAKAGERGRSVLLLDHATKIAEKIRISGGGRCNFTNIYTTANDFLSQNKHFCKSALKQFTQHDFIALVEKYGIAYHEKTLGQLFCDNSAKQIIDMLLQECVDAGVIIQKETQVNDVKQQDSKFYIETNNGIFESCSLVIATGGLSIPKIGASPFGYKIAHQFGLNVVQTYAGLVPLTFSNDLLSYCRDLAGISVPAVVTCGKIRFAEGLLFTHKGLSGPSILQISSYWKKGEKISIDLALDQDTLTFLKQSKLKHPRQDICKALAQILPVRLATAICDEEFIHGRLAEISDKKLQTIANAVHHWCIIPDGTEGYRTAEVTCGGVDTNGLSSKTMECKNVSGLYFIGETVDVTGHLGGFNFQWAWSSGFVAGQNV